MNRILEHAFFQQCMEQNQRWEQERLYCRHDLAHVLDVARIAYGMVLEYVCGLPAKKPPLESYEAWVDALQVGTAKEPKPAAELKYVKEIVYAAALLHDMGKWRQYATGEDHALVGGQLCQGVLADCGFTSAEIAVIAAAIEEHRHKGKRLSTRFLGRILALADFYSRRCFDCPSMEGCKWADRKAGQLIY
ncbi:HD domain-containing protein [Heliophilum fasciatum]|uniref:HD domain-containing protein n=1 Tax=Heliophilum fasciatum TaxID=35700 RepID=UPI0014045C02|nr:HD domain-containing protein [Heliophilum fasciatum]MCW2277068.1 HD superfamily phosphodiesterase [Heliophilum fasciatum]